MKKLEDTSILKTCEKFMKAKSKQITEQIERHKHFI